MVLVKSKDLQNGFLKICSWGVESLIYYLKCAYNIIALMLHIK